MINFIIILLAISSPNIAMEQYETQLTDKAWELEQEKIKQYDSIANPEDIQQAQKEDQDKWDKFMAEPHDGKMFKSNCNSIGECEYYWATPPDMTFNVTSNYGEVRQVSVTCGDGTFANYTAQECQLTKDQIVQNEQIKLFLIAITILSIIVISAVIIFIKTKTDFGDLINIAKIFIKAKKEGKSD